MSKEAHRLRIRSAQDLFKAVKSPDPAVRLGVLRAIVQDPGRAVSYGRHDGMDIVDMLCTQALALSPSTLRTMVLGALGEFRDARVTALFRKEIMVSQDVEVISLTARFLSTQPQGDVHSLFSSLLMQNNSLPHARAAANAMAGFASLSSGERLRIAILSDSDFDPPPLDDKSGAVWLKELEGPLGYRACELIEAQGETAFRLLRPRWEALSGKTQEWLLRWGAAEHPALAVELILTGLDSGCDPLVRTSLECIASLGAAAEMFGTLTGRYLSHADPAIRLAAVRAGIASIDWEKALATENDAAVKTAMISRLAEAKGASAVPSLIRLLEEGDAKVRAAATSALQALGKDAVEGMKPLIDHPDGAVKVAAAQVLIATGEDLWLEEKILS